MRGAILAEAERWIGTPYRHQAATRGAGCDCLGLISGVWAGVTETALEPVPAYTMDWSEPLGKERLWSALAARLEPVEAPVPGDILLFRMRDGAVAKHLGILCGPDRFIHAYSGRGVVRSHLSAPWARRVVGAFAFPQIDNRQE